MYSSKLIHILRTFSSKELKDFELYIRSPLFNRNKSVLNLLSILKKHHPELTDNSLSYENTAHKLFGSADIRKLRYVMTDLTKLAEQFMALLIHLKAPEKNRLQAYQERSLDKFFQQELKKQEELLTVSPIRDDSHYQFMQELNELSFKFTLEHDNRNIDTTLQSLVDHLDLYYLTRKLKYSAEIINRMNILNVQYDIKLLENLLEFLHEHPFDDAPQILVYQQILKTLQQPEKRSNYEHLKVLITTHLTAFNRDDQYDLFGYLQNYCIKQINSGNIDYLNELFDNYNTMIEREVVIKNGTIAQFDFKNMVTVALRVEQYEWTAKFIDNYQHHLPEEQRINAVTYNKARLYFYRQQYRNCLKELLTVEFTDIFYSLDSRALLLKSYYELEDFESALSLINAFKIYLKRDKKVSGYQKDTYLNFLKIVNQLTRYKLGYLKSGLPVEKMIKNTKQVADLTWINQKFRELNLPDAQIE
ncbi:MAG: hypothetical protein KDD41_03215 [Flavobacteriales bacterium]|nr:hypothetical protein [Flavobacteriales bacterium]